MPKTNAEAAREYIARKRHQARKAGFCGQCCKERPNPGYTICANCNSATLERKRRRLQKKHSINVTLVDEGERAGDAASAQHFYAAAVQHYQNALNARIMDPS